MSDFAFVLDSPELALLLVGGFLVVGLAFVVERISRALRHGFSIRLQLFLAIALISSLCTALIGTWAIQRLQLHAAEVMPSEGSASEVVLRLIRDFGPKTFLLLSVIGLVSAGAAFALGRGLARPLERLTQAAQRIAQSERSAPLPTPSGRELRGLTSALKSMRRALEDRHHIQQFVADLSHELKNPVSAVRAATEVLLEGAAEDPQARARFLARIHEASQRLELLLQDLLALARLEAQGLEQLEVVELNVLLEEALEAQGQSLEEKQIQLRIELPPIQMMGNRRWLRRSFDNLLSNALRYSPQGGLLRVSLLREGGALRIRVWDQGPGVPEHLKGRLFERFVTDRVDPNGTGLGLAILRSVGEQHGGGARLLESDSGACFELYLREDFGIQWP